MSISAGGLKAGLGGKSKSELRRAGRTGRETQAKMREARKQATQYAEL
jgi:hypothetical protein